MSAVMIRGAGRPGISAVVMMMSTSGHCCGVQRRLPRLVVLPHLLGISGRGDLDLRGFDRQVLAAQRPHLVGHLRPRIGGPHDRTQLPAAPIAASPATPAPTTSTFAGGTLPGRGDLSGEEPAEHMRRLHHRSVPRDVRHRRQHVQGLRPRDPRHRIHCQRRDADERANASTSSGLRRRREQADQGRALRAAKAISSAFGALTLSTISLPHASAVAPMDAPASAYASSVNDDA